MSKYLGSLPGQTATETGAQQFIISCLKMVQGQNTQSERPCAFREDRPFNQGFP